MKHLKTLPILAVLFMALTAPAHAACAAPATAESSCGWDAAFCAGDVLCARDALCAGNVTSCADLSCLLDRTAPSCVRVTGWEDLWKLIAQYRPEAEPAEPVQVPDASEPTEPVETPVTPEPSEPVQTPAKPEPAEPVQTPTKPEPAQPAQPEPAQPTAPAVSDYEAEVARLVNDIRARYGLNALTLDGELSRGARMKSQDMRDKGYFAHNSPTYGTPFEMMKSLGITYRTAGENIAYGYRTPAAVVEGWMNSEGHRANILNSAYTRIGVGYVADGNYWTQWFVG